MHPIFKPKEHDSEDIKAMAAIINFSEFLAVLVEEVGEVGKAMQGEGDLQEELIQVAAVCCRWLEYKECTE